MSSLLKLRDRNWPWSPQHGRTNWSVIMGYVLAALVLANRLMPANNAPNAEGIFWLTFIGAGVGQYWIWLRLQQWLAQPNRSETQREQLLRAGRRLGWTLLFFSLGSLVADVWLGVEASAHFAEGPKLSEWMQKEHRRAWLLVQVMMGVAGYVMSIIWRLFRRFERWRIAIMVLFVPLLVMLFAIMGGILAGYSGDMAKRGALVAGVAPKHAESGQSSEGAPGFLILGLIGLAFVVPMTMSAFARLRNREDKLLIANLEADNQRQRHARELAESQLKLLQAQIEPHFLFNTLGALQHRAEGKAPEAAALAADLIRFLRGSMENLRAERTTLGEDFKMVGAYLGVMQARLGNRLSYRLELPDTLASQFIPTMMLLTLVENALKHGIEPHPLGGEVSVVAAVVTGGIQITVADTGRGVSDLPGSGVGLDNIRTRLQMLYGEKARLDLSENTPQGFIATLMLPDVSEAKL